MRVQIYEGLKADGLTYIDTNMPYLKRYVIKSKWKLVKGDIHTNKYPPMYGASKVAPQHMNNARYWYINANNNNDIETRFWDGLDTRSLPFTEIVEIVDTPHGFSVNGENYNFERLSGDIQVTIEVFQFEGHRAIPRYHTCNYFIIEDNGTEILHLRPCKLLSPYQNHPAGECCMVDVLTNTLYFNQGSGAFSVEGEAGEIIDTTPVINNIISKESVKAVRLREWIRICKKGWINTNILPTEDIKLTTSIILPTIIPWDNVLGAETIPNAHNLRIGTSNGASLFINNSYFINDIKNGDKFDVSIDGSLCNINGVAKSVRMLYCEYPIVLGGLNREGSPYNINDKLIGVTTINDHIFHPAELAIPYETHPIGECCMIDLNSGDLYFNQGSGSFTCEGAFLGYWQDKPLQDHYCDVEGTLHRSVQIFADNGERLKLIWEKNLPWTSHRWLVWTDTIKNSAGNGLLGAQIDFGACNSFKFTYDSDADYSIYNQSQIAIFNDSSNYLNRFSFRSNYRREYDCFYWQNTKPVRKLDFSTPRTIENKGGSVYYVDDVAYDFAEEKYAVKMLKLSDADRTPKNFRVCNLNIDGRTLAPAVLDRPTLASEDNNGIARKQGEAVFVDEERYKQGLPWCFGNVASSGSFSVSDYLIEGEDYERIEGVYSDGTPWIDLRYVRNQNSKIDAVLCAQNPTKREYPGVYGVTYTTSFGNGSNSCFLTQVQLAFRYSNDAEYKDVYFDKSAEYSISDSHGKIICNGVEQATDGRIYSNDPMFLFTMRDRRYGVSPQRMSGYIKSFKISEVSTTILNLIPIRLLHTIEPTCTHNGKGGKVGEIGFFDSVSGKFYGNDGSGEFTEYVP